MVTISQSWIFSYFKQFPRNLFIDEGDDTSKEETDDVLTDADQGGPKDAAEENQNNPQNSSDERKKSDVSNEVGCSRELR